MANKFKRSLAVLIALANGMGLMMNSTDQASAAVLYVDTPSTLSGTNVSLDIDLNLDGLLDAFFAQTKTKSKSGSGPTTQTTTYSVEAVGDTLLTGGGALLDGVLIGDTLDWGSSVTLGTSAKTGGTTSYSGDWLDGSSSGSGYLGFALTLEDGLHYGWIEIALDAAGDSTSILRYAYETIADQSILAGATQSMAAPDLPAVPLPATGLLLLGALAVPLALKRRRKTAA